MTGDKKDEVAVEEKPEDTSEVSADSGKKAMPPANAKEIQETVATAENGISDLEESIIRQVEYYFGDMNLPRDKFLKEQIQLDDGWVPFTTMFNFKRLSNLTKDTEVVIAALAKSESQLMEVSEDKTKLRRSATYPLPELNEERRKELMTRTVYCKGFPKDNVSIDTYLSFFKKYSIPDDIILRRYLDRQKKQWNFKGSIFVTFKTVQDAENFLNEKSVKFEDVELIRLWQTKYLEEKRIEIDEKNKSKAAKKERKQKCEEQKQPAIKLPLGTVLILNNISENIDRDNIKDAVTALGGNVGFVKIDEGKAWIRLQTENTAKTVFEKCTDGIMKVLDEKLECSVLEGEEEQKFLDDMADELMKRRQKQSKHRSGSGGRQNYNRKRKGGGGDHGPSSRKKSSQ